LRFPGLLLEALVNGLSYRRLHQVDVADDVRREDVAKVIMKPAATQALCNQATTARTRYVKWRRVVSPWQRTPPPLKPHAVIATPRQTASSI